MKGPRKHPVTDQNEKYGEGKNIMLNFYQNWISPVKGGNKCPMHPSCSQYAKNAFQAHSWVLAEIITCERLLRCGHELNLYPWVRIDGRIKSYDPVKTIRSKQLEGEDDEKK